MNKFHTLPNWIKQLFQPKNPPTNLTISAFKDHQLNGWFFHQFPITFKEELCFPEILDQLANDKDKLKIMISTTEIPGWNVIHKLDDDIIGGGSTWHWHGKQFWLCSWLKWYFWQGPETLWFSVL